jgi:2-methylisocitrate lyase-like PEP mutase family enzyme
MTSSADLRERFHRLHESGCFVIPNPWDIGSAKLLAQMSFPALATTSSGFAWSVGRADNRITLEQALRHIDELSAAVDVPVNADFEGGFAIDPEQVGLNVTAAAETRVAGLSIEDSTGDALNPLHELGLAVERIRAARTAIDANRSGVLLVGRSEGFICGRPDLGETIRRLVAYADAGADCLYAPGLNSVADVKAVVAAVAPKPVNVLVSKPWTTLAEMRDAGVRRISVGGALARAAWKGFFEAAEEMHTQGTFTALGRAYPGDRLDGAFADR